MGKPDSNSSNLIITFSNDFYKFYYALSLASTLKATGKDVSIFISGYSCHFIKKNWKEYDKEGINEKLPSSPTQVKTYPAIIFFFILAKFL